VAAAAGAAAGVLSDRRKPVRWGLLGAIAGAGIGAAGVVVHERITDHVPLYSSSSDLYDESDAA
jgi:hypothetical protein